MESTTEQINRKRGRCPRETIDSVSTIAKNPSTDYTFINSPAASSDMSSQRSRAPRGGARAGTHETGEEAQLWNDTQEKLVKLEKNEARAKELKKEIFDKEASMKAQEDAGISRRSDFLWRIPTDVRVRTIH